MARRAALIEPRPKNKSGQLSQPDAVVSLLSTNAPAGNGSGAFVFRSSEHCEARYADIRGKPDLRSGARVACLRSHARIQVVSD
jgi:hypothetical protein